MVIPSAGYVLRSGSINIVSPGREMLTASLSVVNVRAGYLHSGGAKGLSAVDISSTALSWETTIQPCLLNANWRNLCIEKKQREVVVC